MTQWRTIKKPFQLKEIKEQSNNKPIAIFKHSTRCGRSAMVKKRLEDNWHFQDEDLPLYYLDILTHRDLSDQVEELFGVEHQSPQLLLIVEGECVYHTSHNSITVDELQQNLPTLQS